jgi:hypothetical protein
VGVIEMPLPELGRGARFLDSSADRVQEMVRSKVPQQYRPSVVVRSFRKRGSTGLSIEYDDHIEGLVMAALEDRDW